MSAYIVDRKHILYLVNAAMSQQIIRSSGFSWYTEERGRIFIRCGDYEAAADAGNMLWRENIASVSCRYPNESSATLPGPINETFVIEAADVNPGMFLTYEPVAVLKACDCYAYQTCEHPGWRDSEAYAFINSLRSSAWHSLPGYDKAEWGAPKSADEIYAEGVKSGMRVRR